MTDRTSEYRRSYRKTVLATGTVTGGCLLALGWMAWIGWAGGGSWPWGAWVLGGLLCLALVAVAACSALIAAGGLISLYRDRLEERGVPYARHEAREWQPGPLTHARRRLVRFAASILPGSPGRLRLRPGDLVEVRSLDQILGTLDEQGTVDHLPFMPEMSAFCGRQFRVFRRVEKIHDYVHESGLRRMHDTVLLEQLRCEGIQHGGCQAQCHLLWKEAWLRRVRGGRSPSACEVSHQSAEHYVGAKPLGATDLVRLSRRVDDLGGEQFVCQMTEVARGTEPLSWADPRHYLRDLVQGNVRPGVFLEGVALALFNGVQRRRGGAGYPYWTPPGRKTSPHASLDLVRGDEIRVKTKREIVETLNGRNRNRGLWFDPEMVRFCGGTYRVAERVERLIEEKSGRLVPLTNPCVILEGVTATGEYLAFCPQNESIFWREIWLDRLPTATLQS